MRASPSIGSEAVRGPARSLDFVLMRLVSSGVNFGSGIQRNHLNMLLPRLSIRDYDFSVPPPVEKWRGIRRLH